MTDNNTSYTPDTPDAQDVKGNIEVPYRRESDRRLIILEREFRAHRDDTNEKLEKIIEFFDDISHGIKFFLFVNKILKWVSSFLVAIIVIWAAGKAIITGKPPNLTNFFN